jgi:hypothetical protein
MRSNQPMKSYLADLRSREVDASTLAAPKVDIVEAGGVFLLSGAMRKRPLHASEFPDATKLECSANRLRMESMVAPRLARACPLLLLTAGLMTARAMAVELTRFQGRFNVILSYDGDSCAVRFHKIRAGERWLADDLDDTYAEGVLVFEAGAAVEVPALTG